MPNGGDMLRGGGAAAVAERLLRAASDPHGRRPFPWTAAPLVDAELVLDLCCGTGALADELPTGRWLGVDSTAAPGHRRPLIRGVPHALPLGSGAVDGIAVLLALPHIADLDGMFAELRRVLRPGGTLVLLVPSALPRSIAELRLAAVHRAAWPHRAALDQAGWLLAMADFAVMSDDRASFALPLPDAAAAYGLVAELPPAGLWPRDLPPAVRDRVAAGLACRAGPGRVLPLPLRRLVARR